MHMAFMTARAFRRDELLRFKRACIMQGIEFRDDLADLFLRIR